MPFDTANCGAEEDEEAGCRIVAAFNDEEGMLLLSSTAGVGEGVGKAEEMDFKGAEIDEESPGTCLTWICEMFDKEVSFGIEVEKEQVWEDGNAEVGIEVEEVDAADEGGEAGMLVEGDGKTEESAVGVALENGRLVEEPFIFSVLLNLIISFLVKPFEKQHFSFLEIQAEQDLNCK